MKHFYIILFVVFTNIFQLFSQIQGYSLNQTVNDFTVTDTHGVQHNLYNYTSQGKYVYLDFFFSTCGPCQQTTPIFNQFYTKYGCNSGNVVCISINSGMDNNAAVINFENTYGGTANHCPAISNQGGCTNVKNAFNPAAYPTYCLISPQNKLLNSDIWPISNVATFEATFPSGFTPPVMSCAMSTEDVTSNLFQMYPNPVKGNTLFFEFSDTNNSLQTLEIYNYTGQLLYKDENFFKNSLEHSLTSGTYFVKFTTENTTQVQKLLIE